MFIIVAYDIMADERRTRVASELENFGERVQFSVFECHLREEQLKELQRRIKSLILESEDRVNYYTLCEKDRHRIIVDGPGGVTKDWDYFIV